jgi:hypothetical protein
VQWPGGKEYFKNLKTEAEIYQIPIYSFSDLFQQDPTIPLLRIMNEKVSENFVIE